MPLYRCMVAEGLSSFEQRAELSKQVTRIHCAVTGAPEKFVHTFFAEDSDGQLPDGKRAVVLGSIRAGRTAEQKEQLTSELLRSAASILRCPEEEVMVATADIPARWIMEGGAIMPEPGDEEAWLARHDSA